ncbi:MAG: RluA family pseudouridine synthase [Verrucomicrobia bacterium]|nr:RluA family pseudouridine synthase [Verrucomicrobiota bacterium]
MPPLLAAERLDLFLAAALPGLTRSRLQGLIKAGKVVLDGQPAAKSGQLLRGGERIRVEEQPPAPLEAVAQDIALDVLFEDDDLLVLNKPPGLVTHPAPGHPDGTLVNALLHHCATLSRGSAEARPGIVHRLDKDTSGLLVVAKNDPAHLSLARQFEERSTEKFYLALVRGWPRGESGRIDAPIGRHRTDRKKMAVVAAGAGRSALTTWRVLQRFGPEALGLPAALVECQLHTGRTHQIRVHLKHLGHPILGDATYGGPVKGVRPEPARQLLHAWRLALAHPRTGQRLSFEAPPPADFGLAALGVRL